MSESDLPPPPRTETDMPRPGGLAAEDVGTYTTLANAGTLLLALVHYEWMWLPAAVFFLYLRNRDQAGLLRAHLAGALSFAAVMTGYFIVIRQVVAVADLEGRWLALWPIIVAAAVAFPAVQASQAARRLRPYTFPKPLAWLPLR
ncbi:hypothetical protein DPM19_05795 [Actinomadura craniellae]|uniref:Uncharacterized protein n=1 Tax=Actinomadura craniellae TaxID=2231787 RepID=A0A365HBA8_9ACTN|nr:hypothetical protein [Actinomadura craniellae]RAY16387.1 hypothetical protein DPM19_05795 [Actinomadura craniellae]